MNTNDKTKDITEAFRSLSKKTAEVTSKDGLISLIFTGNGDYKSVKINSLLDSVTREQLENAFLDALDESKRNMSESIMTTLLNIVDDEEANEQSEDKGVTIENVS